MASSRLARQTYGPYQAVYISHTDWPSKQTASSTRCKTNRAANREYSHNRTSDKAGISSATCSSQARRRRQTGDRPGKASYTSWLLQPGCKTASTSGCEPVDTSSRQLSKVACESGVDSAARSCQSKSHRQTCSEFRPQSAQTEGSAIRVTYFLVAYLGKHSVDRLRFRQFRQVHEKHCSQQLTSGASSEPKSAIRRRCL